MFTTKLMKKIAVFALAVTATNLLAACSNQKLTTNKSNQPTTTAESTVKQETTAQQTAAASPEATASAKPEGTKTEDTKKEGTATSSNSGTPAPKKDIKVKAFYLTGWTVGSMEKVQHYIDVAKTTEINAYVIDIKDDDGYVGYESSIPQVREIGAWQKKYDVDKAVKAFHDNNVHLIGRVVCFKDPVLSSKRPDLAIKHSNGGLWRDNHGKTWLDPYNKDSWPYIIEVAREGVKKGFDEIQFDYIRFANDGAKKAMSFKDNGKKKYEVINEFLAYAKKELPGVVISADVFGIICESPADTEEIGQYLELVGKDIDYISPMVYPSHYASGQKVNGVTFMKPDLEPYNVIYQTMLKTKDRLSKVTDYKAKVRPYLQDFTASWLPSGYYMTYGDEQVRQQIKAVYDAGYEEWILWDAGNKYCEAAMEKEK